MLHAIDKTIRGFKEYSFYVNQPSKDIENQLNIILYPEYTVKITNHDGRYHRTYAFYGKDERKTKEIDSTNFVSDILLISDTKEVFLMANCLYTSGAYYYNNIYDRYFNIDDVYDVFPFTRSGISELETEIIKYKLFDMYNDSIFGISKIHKSDQWIYRLTINNKTYERYEYDRSNMPLNNFIVIKNNKTLDSPIQVKLVPVEDFNKKYIMV